MRLTGKLLTATLLTALVAGCGGDSTKTVTVGAPPAQQTTPSGDTPPETATTPTPSDPVATEAPPANLPEGAIAIQGRFQMRIAESKDSAFVSGDERNNEGDQRLWFTKTTCDATCSVELRRELPNRAFETVTLEAVEGDPTRYATEGNIKKDACSARPVGPASRRISVKASATKDVEGKLVATRLDGYVVVTQRCDSFENAGPPEREKSTTQYRGTANSG